jgi:hypothetical protein
MLREKALHTAAVFEVTETGSKDSDILHSLLCLQTAGTSIPQQWRNKETQKKQRNCKKLICISPRMFIIWINWTNWMAASNKVLTTEYDPYYSEKKSRKDNCFTGKQC